MLSLFRQPSLSRDPDAAFRFSQPAHDALNRTITDLRENIAGLQAMLRGRDADLIAKQAEIDRLTGELLLRVVTMERVRRVKLAELRDGGRDGSGRFAKGVMQNV